MGVVGGQRAASPAVSALAGRGDCFLLAICLFLEVGFLLVWQKLTASLTALPVVTPATKAPRAEVPAV
ncbi:hypothetical protein ABZ912_47800 [Nonomuraea angiospora]|uniref:hypothetical protein n=1 Tax=Nonomuraea angiospora TaxID=46172 RepID=UPI0033C64E8A